MVITRSYRLLPLLPLISEYNSVYAMHTLARTDIIRKVLVRTHAHAARRFYTAHQAHTSFKLSSTDSQDNYEQSNSQEQQSKEQHYQTFKNRFYTASAFVVGAGAGYLAHELYREHNKKCLLWHIITKTSNKRLILHILNTHNFDVTFIQKHLIDAVSCENYTRVAVLLETLPPNKINNILKGTGNYCKTG